MAFPKKKGSSGSVRLTGLFKTRRKGLWTGTAKSEQINGLIETVKEAKREDKGLVFFLWRNDQHESPVFNLTVAVAQSQEDRPRGKKINDPFADEEPGEEEIPF